MKFDKTRELQARSHELIPGGAHTGAKGDDIDRTIEAVRGALSVYRRAMDEGTDPFLVGRPSKIVYRRHN